MHKIPHDMSDLWKSASAANGGLKVAYIYNTNNIFCSYHQHLKIHVKNPKQKRQGHFRSFLVTLILLALHPLSTELANVPVPVWLFCKHSLIFPFLELESWWHLKYF